MVESRWQTDCFLIPEPEATQLLVTVNIRKAFVTQAPSASKPDWGRESGRQLQPCGKYFFNEATHEGDSWSPWGSAMKHVAYVFSLWDVLFSCRSDRSSRCKMPWGPSSCESCTLQPLAVPDGGHITAARLPGALGDTHTGL